MNNFSLYQRRKIRTSIAAAIFLLPALFLMIVYIAYPILQSFYSSTMDWNSIETTKTFIGLNNWKKLMDDKAFWIAFTNNLKIMFLSVAIQIPVAMALATFLDYGGKKFNFFKVVYFFPLLMSSVAIGFLFRYGFDPNFGIIASISKLFGGGAVDLLGNDKRALYTIIGVICWQYIPFYMVYFLAAYSCLSVEIYEAAKVDGATNGQYFWRIALPQMKPAVKTGVILAMIGSLKYFELVFVMTGGGPYGSTELMATYMYKKAFVQYRMGYGSTIATAMFILITAISLVTLRIINSKERKGG